MILHATPKMFLEWADVNGLFGKFIISIFIISFIFGLFCAFFQVIYRKKLFNLIFGSSFLSLFTMFLFFIHNIVVFLQGTCSDPEDCIPKRVFWGITESLPYIDALGIFVSLQILAGLISTFIFVLSDGSKLAK